MFYQKRADKRHIPLLSMCEMSPVRKELKRQSLIEKFAFALKLKHSKLFKNKNYTINMLHADLNALIQEDNMYNNINYDNWIFKLDQEIINKVIQLPHVVNPTSSLPEVANNSNLNNSSDIFDKVENNLVITKSISQAINPVSSKLIDESKVYPEHNRKLFELRIKEKEIWGKKAIENYQSFMEEKKQNKLQMREKKIEMKEMLNKQIQEKKKLTKVQVLDKDDYYTKLILKDKLKYDQTEHEKKNLIKAKLIELDKDRKKFVIEHKKMEEDITTKEKKLDNIYLDNNKKELENEKEEYLRKKEKEKVYAVNLKELLYAKQNEVNESKLKDKIEDCKIEKDLLERLNRRDKLRESYLNSIKAKFEKGQTMSSSTQIHENFLKEEEMKIKKEIEEEDIRYIIT